MGQANSLVGRGNHGLLPVRRQDRHLAGLPESRSSEKAAQERPQIRKERPIQPQKTQAQAVPQEIKCWINEKGQRFCSNVVPPPQPETPAAKTADPAAPPSQEQTTAKASVNFMNLTPKEFATIIGCCLVIIIGFIYLTKSQSKPRAKNLQQKQHNYDFRDLIGKTRPAQQPTGDSLEMRHLLHMLLHDRKAAERLIAYEKQLDPSLTREECIREAIARIRRDQE